MIDVVKLVLMLVVNPKDKRPFCEMSGIYETSCKDRDRITSKSIKTRLKEHYYMRE